MRMSRTARRDFARWRRCVEAEDRRRPVEDLARLERSEMRVEDVMTVDVAAVKPESSLKDVARELSGRRISGMPVVDDDGRVIGVISEADVLAKEESEPEQPAGVMARLLDRERDEPTGFGARVVREAMTSPPITIEPHWPVAMAAEQMINGGVNRLPVVREGRLVGIVTRADLVRAFARSDEQIAGDIREMVALQQELWRDQQPVEVRIEAGEVTLAGEVRRRDEAIVLPKMVRTVPGVVSVRSGLTWSEEDRPIPAT
jgi:CBS domain-containing protein